MRISAEEVRSFRPGDAAAMRSSRAGVVQAMSDADKNSAGKDRHTTNSTLRLMEDESCIPPSTDRPRRSRCFRR